MAFSDCSGLHTHSRPCSYVHTSKEPGQRSKSPACIRCVSRGVVWIHVRHQARQDSHLKSKSSSQGTFHIALKFQSDRLQPVIFHRFFSFSMCFLCIRPAQPRKSTENLRRYSWFGGQICAASLALWFS